MKQLYSCSIKAIEISHVTGDPSTMNSSKAELQFLQFPQQDLNMNRKTTKQYMAKIRQENEPFASRLVVTKYKRML